MPKTVNTSGRRTHEQMTDLMLREIKKKLVDMECENQLRAKQLNRIERTLKKIMGNNREQELALDATLEEVKTAVAAAADRVIRKLEAAQTANDIDLSDEISSLEGLKTAAGGIAPDDPTPVPPPDEPPVE